MNSEYILGKMAECTKVFIRKIRSTVMACILGQIIKSTLVGGIKESNMVLVFSSLEKEERKSSGFGRTAKKFAGSLLRKSRPSREILISISQTCLQINQG
jgi:hypothetical protein